jgi:hypothetical protein
MRISSRSRRLDDERRARLRQWQQMSEDGSQSDASNDDAPAHAPAASDAKANALFTERRARLRQLERPL